MKERQNRARHNSITALGAPDWARPPGGGRCRLVPTRCEPVDASCSFDGWTDIEPKPDGRGRYRRCWAMTLGTLVISGIASHHQSSSRELTHPPTSKMLWTVMVILTSAIIAAAFAGFWSCISWCPANPGGGTHAKLATSLASSTGQLQRDLSLAHRLLRHDARPGRLEIAS